MAFLRDGTVTNLASRVEDLEGEVFGPGASAYQLGNRLNGVDGTTVGAALVTSTGSTTARTLAARFADVVNVRDFGAVCNGTTDDTAAWSAAFAALSSAQTRLRFSGTTRITGPVVVPRGMTIEGNGPTYGSVFYLDGPTAAVKLLGSVTGSGGWEFRQYFRNMTIRPRPGSVMAAKLVELESAYNVEFHDVHVDLSATVASDIPVGGTTCFDFTTVNAIILNNVVVRGANDLSTQTACKGVNVSGDSSVKLINPDIEVFNRGVYVGAGGIVDLVAPYMERNIIGVDNQGGAGTVINSYGGRVSVANNSCQPFRLSVSGGLTCIWGTVLENALGTNKVYAWQGARYVYLDAETGRLASGVGVTGGGQVDTPPYAIQINPTAVQGITAGFGLGEFVQDIGEAATFSDDWELRYVGAGSKTARFFAVGAGVLNLYSDGTITAVRRVSSGRVALTYSATIALDASLGNVFEIQPTDGNAYTLSNPGSALEGQTITVRVKNTFGALGAMTWGAAYKMTAWTQPANGFSRSITFQYDGTSWVEVSRSAADVPN